MTRFRLLNLTLGLVVLTSIGCRSTCKSSQNDRDDRYGTASRPKTTQPNCDPVLTGYGQPIMQGAVVGAVPGPSMPITGGFDRPDGELPFPQPTIPSPSVPSSPPIASIPSPSFGLSKGR